MTGSGPFSLATYPMHGLHKLLSEGFRTRDGHLIEWFASLVGDQGSIAVVSRPEPFPRRQMALRGRLPKPDPRITDLGRSVLAVPHPLHRQDWWRRSARLYPAPIPDVPTIVWNPFATSSITQGSPEGHVDVFDVLDDWTVHAAFAPIRADVETAYARTFEAARTVFANSEATLELAHRFGRQDAVLMPNGVDPGRFSTVSAARGASTVGYIGKLGSRVDLDLIDQVVRQCGQVQFVLAGPAMDRSTAQRLRRLPANVEWRGDVHYSQIPALLTTFDLGWIPHFVGRGEVGGDAIKLYEYRAAGLPVVATDIIGVQNRGLSHIHVRDAADHAATILELTGAGADRVARVPEDIDPELTWEFKARKMASVVTR